MPSGVGARRDRHVATPGRAQRRRGGLADRAEPRDAARRARDRAAMIAASAATCDGANTQHTAASPRGEQLGARARAPDRRRGDRDGAVRDHVDDLGARGAQQLERLGAPFFGARHEHALAAHVAASRSAARASSAPSRTSGG